MVPCKSVHVVRFMWFCSMVLLWWFCSMVLLWWFCSRGSVRWFCSCGSVHVVLFMWFLFRWFCEGKQLENSPDLQVLAAGALQTLVIAEAFEEDTGRYCCFASNVYGTDSTSAEIYVEGDDPVLIRFCRAPLVTASCVLTHRRLLFGLRGRAAP